MYEARSHAQPVMQASWRVSRRRGSWPAGWSAAALLRTASLQSQGWPGACCLRSTVQPRRVVGLPHAELLAQEQMQIMQSALPTLEQQSGAQPGSASPCLSRAGRARRLQSIENAPQCAERAVAGVHQAIEVGALGFLGSSIVRGAFFEDELPFHRELYAQTFHQLLMGFLDAEPGRYACVRCPMLDLLYNMCTGVCSCLSTDRLWLTFAMEPCRPCGMYSSLG